MIKVISISFLMILILVVTGIGIYLSPNDLASCGHFPTQNANCQKVDAIVAVSGGNTSLRTKGAIELFKRGWAKYIIFSGDALDTKSPSNASIMRQQALAAGIPKDVIITEDSSQTTHQNAKKTNQLLVEHNINSLIVVTSPYHQRRTAIEFTKYTDQHVKVLSHPIKNDPDWPWYWWITPRGWWLAIGELAKISAVQAGESR